MATEIEHKYLVKDTSFKDLTTERHFIIQGYLSKEKGRTVRVRTWDQQGFITVKGANVGASRPEFEYEIPYDDALAMLQNICIQPVLTKVRNIVMHDGNRWEVDEFLGTLEGLITAEIEIPSEDYKYSLPDFVGENVTGNRKYYNSCLQP